MIELSIYKDRAYREPRRVYSAKTAGQMRDMLAKVVEKGGTGFRARVEGYTAAGKTGTAYKGRRRPVREKVRCRLCGLRTGTQSPDCGGHYDR